MRKQVTFVVCSALGALTLFLAGCAKDPAPPAPLAAEQIPAELDKAFRQAKPETKDLVSKLSSSLQSKDYPAAYDAVQALGTIPESSKDQQVLVARASLTIYGLLQTAQAAGDDKANAAVEHYKATR